MNLYGRYWPTIRTVLVLLLIVLPTASVASQERYRTREGVIDLREYPGTLQAVFRLHGKWEWYWGELLTPEELRNRTPDSFLEIPADLTRRSSENEGQVHGVATLRLRVLLPRGRADRALALDVPYFGSAHRIYVNGRRVVEVGRIGTPPDYADFRAQYLPVEVPIGALDEDRPTELEIVVNVANFNHRRLRLLDISIGPQSVIKRATQYRLISEGILFGSLLLLAIYHLLLYVIHRTDQAFLYFGLVALVTAMREGVIGERILVRVWPAMPAEMMMKIGFSPVFLLPWLLALYLFALTRRGTLPWLQRITRGLFVAFLGLLGFTKLPVYDWVFQFGMPFILAFGIIVLVLVLRKRPFQQRGAPMILLVGTIAVVAAATNDYLRELYSPNAPELFSLGILAFLLLQAYFLAWRLKEAQLVTERLQKEAVALADQLEDRIAERTRELEVANATLQTLSQLDPLTSIANRRAFEETLDREWRRCVRSHTVLALVMVDVDMFKRYNDYYGHPAGDQCLKEIAETLQSGIHRSTDLLARYGGEEFVVLLPEAGPNAARTIAETMRASIQALEIPHEASTVAEVVTASFGVVSIRAGAAIDVSTVVEFADRALYAAKQAGRNQVYSASPDRDGHT